MPLPLYYNTAIKTNTDAAGNIKCAHTIAQIKKKKPKMN